jgi:hypothetical protein
LVAFFNIAIWVAYKRCDFSNATRRLSFQTPSFYARHPSTSRDVFIPESPDRPTNDHCWGPGESLPTSHLQPVAISSPVQMQAEQPDLFLLIQGTHNLHKIFC